MIGWFATSWLSMPWLVRFACGLLLFFSGMQITGIVLEILNSPPIYYLIGWGLLLASFCLAVCMMRAINYAHSLESLDFVSEKGEAVAPSKSASPAFAATMLLMLVLLAAGSRYADAWFVTGECVTTLPSSEKDWLYAWVFFLILLVPLALLLLAVLLDALLPSVRRCGQIEFSVSKDPEDVLRKRAQFERIACYHDGFEPPVPAEPEDGNTYTLEANKGLVRALVGSVRIVVEERSPSKVAFLYTAQRGYEAHNSLELNGNSLLCQFDVRTGLRLDKLMVYLMGRKTYARYMALVEAKRIAQSGDCEVRILSVTPSC